MSCAVLPTLVFVVGPFQMPARKSNPLRSKERDRDVMIPASAGKKPLRLQCARGIFMLTCQLASSHLKFATSD